MCTIEIVRSRPTANKRTKGVHARAPAVSHWNVQQVAQPGLFTTEPASRHRNATPEKDKCWSKRHKELQADLQPAFYVKGSGKTGLSSTCYIFGAAWSSPSLQYAYRKHHSTETAVLKVVSDVLLAADRGDVMLLGRLDLSVAFDTVDHEILINRLQISFGICGKVLSWILSFISQRTQIASINGKRVNKISSCLWRTTRRRPRARVVSAVYIHCDWNRSPSWNHLALVCRWHAAFYPHASFVVFRFHSYGIHCLQLFAIQCWHTDNCAVNWKVLCLIERIWLEQLRLRHNNLL